MRWIWLAVVIPALALAPGYLAGAERVVVTLGADLTEEQRELMGDLLDVNDTTEVVQVTNGEERALLEGMVPPEVIGRRAISSARVEPAPKGSGIKVQTYNISWVTPEMYAGALATAGMHDAQVVAAAPFSVSGTAALTGILKAFEVATDTRLSEQSKRVAGQEVVTGAEIGRELGDRGKAATLIGRVKERVVAGDIKDPEQIQQVIINVAGDLNINLSDKQVKQIADLMRQIAGLNLQVADLRQQVGNMGERLAEVARTQVEVRTLLERILAVLQQVVERLEALLGVSG